MTHEKRRSPEKGGPACGGMSVRDQKEIPTRMPKFWQLSIE